MKFEALDDRMRVYERAHDHCVLPGIFMVARLDGRNFTRLTKEIQAFEAPFDERFRDAMVGVTEHLMDCGFRVVYGYTESDEISLLFAREEDAFSRKLRKFNSVLAGEASAKMSLLLGCMAAFDCRISQLPNENAVVDYFRWRNEDSHRNALNAHCYWQLRKQGDSAAAATSRLVGMSTADKNELLFQQGINFNDLPNWQKRGVGVYWEMHDKAGRNPITGEVVTASRRRIRRDMDLPMKDAYSDFIRGLLRETGQTKRDCR